MTAASAGRLRLVVVTDRRLVPGRLVEAVSAALDGGATAVQLREKDLSAGDLLERARALRRVTSARGALLLVNDRVDVALAAGADGVHLAAASIPPADARRIAGDRLLVGVSTHTPDEAAKAARAGADYVVFGPVHETPSKAGILEPRGLEGLEAAVALAAPTPVVAIGGLDGDRAGAAIRAGAAGVAVIRAILLASDARQAAASLRRGIEDATKAARSGRAT